MVDIKLYEELAAKSIDDVILPPFCKYDFSKKCYTISVWNSSFEIYPEKQLIQLLGKGDSHHDYFGVFLVNYLLSQKKSVPAGIWISEKDLVGGPTFFRGPHEIPTYLISDCYGNDLERLQSRCLSMGGEELSMADCSYGFDVVASVKVALLYWQGDEDFPPEAKILMDSSVAEMLKLDVVYALLCDVCSRLAAK